MDEELKKRIEALLFSVGNAINVADISKMCKERDRGKIVAALIELKSKYNNDSGNSLMIIQDGENWKLTIKDQYIDVAKEIGIETELKKTVMETLAVIAYKNPVLQSEVIKVRTNKAYDHLSELEQLGYIERERYGRTKKIKLTAKFFEYFDLPPDSLKEKFNNVSEMERIISDKEKRIHSINELKKDKIEAMKKEDEEEARKNIYMADPNNPNVKDLVEGEKGGIGLIKEEKLGELTVIDSEPAIAEPSQKGIWASKDKSASAGDKDALSTYDVEPLAFEKSPQAPSVDKTLIETIDRTSDLTASIEKVQEKKQAIDKQMAFEEEQMNAESGHQTIAPEDEKRDTLQTQSEKDEPTIEDIGNEAPLTHAERNHHHPEGAARDAQQIPLEIRHPVLDDMGRDAPQLLHANIKLSEERLFNMEGIPEKIMNEIEKKAEEIVGEAKPGKAKEPNTEPMSEKQGE